MTAINTSHETAASKLLSAGANPRLEFDEFIKAYLRSNVQGRISSPEQNMKQFEILISQPIHLAVTKEMPSLMHDLLALNVDPSTLNTTAHTILQNPNNARSYKGETVIDAVRTKIKFLQQFLDGPKYGTLPEPERLKSKSEYLSEFTAGTYKYWTAENDFEVSFSNNSTAWEQYKSKGKEPLVATGAAEKVHVIKKMIQNFETVEKVLLSAGAKTFSEMHPDIMAPRDHIYRPLNSQPPKPWEPKFSFEIPDLNPVSPIIQRITSESNISLGKSCCLHIAF